MKLDYAIGVCFGKDAARDVIQDHQKYFDDPDEIEGLRFAHVSTRKELAVRFHHKLVYIYLFPNGNGRHARIMADALLTIVMNDLPIEWAGGETLDNMGSRRNDYISALRLADKHDFKALAVCR